MSTCPSLRTEPRRWLTTSAPWKGRFSRGSRSCPRFFRDPQISPKTKSHPLKKNDIHPSPIQCKIRSDAPLCFFVVATFCINLTLPLYLSSFIIFCQISPFFSLSPFQIFPTNEIAGQEVRVCLFPIHTPRDTFNKKRHKKLCLLTLPPSVNKNVIIFLYSYPFTYLQFTVNTVRYRYGIVLCIASQY